MTKIQNLKRFGHWDFDIVCYLLFGAWDFFFLSFAVIGHFADFFRILGDKVFRHLVGFVIVKLPRGVLAEIG